MAFGVITDEYGFGSENEENCLRILSLCANKGPAIKKKRLRAGSFVLRCMIVILTVKTIGKGVGASF